MPGSNPLVSVKSFNANSSNLSNIFDQSVLSLGIQLMGGQAWRDQSSEIRSKDDQQEQLKRELSELQDNFNSNPDFSRRNLVEKYQQILDLKKQELKAVLRQHKLALKKLEPKPEQSWGKWAISILVDLLESPQQTVDRYQDIINKRESEILTLSEMISELQSLQYQTSQRHLLSIPTVVQPILDQIISVNEEYKLSLNDIFDGDFNHLFLRSTYQSSLPNWVSFQYPVFSSFGLVSNQINYKNNRVYISGAGLHVLDLSNENAPYFVGTYPGTFYAIDFLSDNRAVAILSSGLQVLNISDPSNISVLGSYNASYYFQYFYLYFGGGLSVKEDLVFKVDSNFGVEVFNINNNIPNLISSYTLNNIIPLSISAFDNYAVIGHMKGFEIINATDTANITKIYDYSFGGDVVVGNILFKDQVAYMAIMNRGIYVYNMSNPVSPQLIYNYVCFPSALAIEGNLLAVADVLDGIRIFEINNYFPFELRGFLTSSSGHNVLLVNNVVIGDIQYQPIVNFGDLRRGNLIGTPSFDLYESIFSLTVAGLDSLGNTLISDDFQLTIDQFPVSRASNLDQSILPGSSLDIGLYSRSLFSYEDFDRRFLTLSISDQNGGDAPSWMNFNFDPFLRGTYNSFSIQYDISPYRDNIILLGMSNGMAIIDFTNIASPALLSQTLSNIVYDIEIKDDTAYVVESSFGLKRYDISNLSAPRLTGSHQLQNGVLSAFEAEIQEGVIFLSERTQLEALDISSLMPLGSYNYTLAATDRVQGLVVQNNIVYIANRDGLTIVNATVPSNMQLIKNYPTNNSAYAVTIKNNILFLGSSGDYGLQIFDISHLPTLERIARYYIFNSLYDIDIYGHTAFLSCSTSNLQFLDISNLNQPIQRGSYAPVQPLYPIKSWLMGQNVFITDFNGLLRVIDASRFKLSLSPSQADVGNYPVELIATTELGGSALTSFTIRVEGQPYRQGSDPSQFAKVGQLYNYFFRQFTDPNRDVITYTVLPSLPWLSFNQVSAIFSGIPSSNDVGNFTLWVVVSDGITHPVNVTLNLYVDHKPENDQPLAPQIIGIDIPFRWRIPSETFYDGDGDPLDLSVQKIGQQPLPQFMNFSSPSRELQALASANDAGDYQLEVIAQDLHGGRTVASLSITVEHYPKVLPSSSPVLLGVNIPFNYEISRDRFEDEDDSIASLRYELRKANGLPVPSWLEFDPSRLEINGIPSAVDLGNISLSVKAIDPHGGFGEGILNLIVTFFPSVLSDQIPRPPLYREGRYFEFNIPQEVFANVDMPRYSALLADGSSLPDWLNFNNLTFSGIPPEESIGVVATQVTGEDSRGLQASFTVTFLIGQNRAPVLENPISTQTVGVGQNFKLDVSGTFADPDLDNMTYDVNPGDLPGWLRFINHTFFGRPNGDDTEPFADKSVSITLFCRDDKSISSTSFNINVSGDSNYEIALRVLAPLMTILIGAYKCRRWLLGKLPPRYPLEDKTVYIGQNAEFDFPGVPLDKIKTVEVRPLKPEPKNACSKIHRFFTSDRQILPGGLLMPEWAKFKSHGRLTIQDVPESVEPIHVVSTKDGHGIPLSRNQLRFIKPEGELHSPSLPSIESKEGENSGPDIELANLHRQDSVQPPSPLGFS